MRAKRLAAAFLMGLLVSSLVGCRLLPQIISDGQKQCIGFKDSLELLGYLVTIE